MRGDARVRTLGGGGGVLPHVRGSKALFLDPVEESFPSDILETIHGLLYSKTQLRGFSLLRLGRGGVRVLFKSVNARKYGEEVLRSHIRCRPAKLSWLQVKKTFEVVVRGVPRTTAVEGLMDVPHVVKVKDLKFGRVVLFMDSFEAASKLIDEGLWFQGMFFSVRPWSFKPRVSCLSCGSMSHTQCEKRICFKCGVEGHVSGDCPNDESVRPLSCLRCGDSNHLSSDCPVFKEKSSKAYQRKKKTYAEALGASKKATTPAHVRARPPQVDVFALVQTVVLTVLQVLNVEMDPLPIIEAVEQAMHGVGTDLDVDVECDMDMIREDDQEAKYPDAVEDQVSVEEEEDMHVDECLSKTSSEDVPPAKRPAVQVRYSVLALRCSCSKAGFTEVAAGKHRLGRSHGIVCGCGITFRSNKEIVAHVKSCDHIVDPM
jgi:hypothetical protein